MKKLILKMSASIDGFVGGPKGESEWIFRTHGDDATKWDIKKLWEVSLHLMGSRTYQDMAAWWPTSTEKYAPPMNEIPKAVFSRRGLRLPNAKLTTLSLKGARATNPQRKATKASVEIWESWLYPQVFTGKLATEIKRLKRGSGKPLLAHGGASFARSLIGTGLVDEYMLMVHPVVLGKGMSIFSDVTRPLDLTLIESIGFKSGQIMQIYRPKKKRA